MAPQSNISLLIGTGFLGSYTTFSTFKLEGMELLSAKRWKMASFYFFASYIGGPVLAFLGLITTSKQ